MVKKNCSVLLRIEMVGRGWAVGGIRLFSYHSGAGLTKGKAN